MRRAIAGARLLLFAVSASSVCLSASPASSPRLAHAASVPSATRPRGQVQPPTFRAASVYVQVDASVFDARGQFVRGLKKEDFRVTQDGQAQEVEHLELVDSPGGADSAPAPSLQAPQQAPAGAAGAAPPARRVYYLVVDDLHPRAERTTLARELAREFLGRVPGSGDLVGMRKTLVLVSEGIDPNKGGRGKFRGDPTRDNPFDGTVDADVEDEMKAVIALANRANVSVYAVDPRGVAGRLGDNVEAAAVTNEVLRAEEKRSQEILEDLAASTDGTAFVRTSDFAHAFDRIRADSNTYYLLSYRRPATSAPGYHRIQVKVARPGVTVRARRGYDDKLAPW